MKKHPVIRRLYQYIHREVHRWGALDREGAKFTHVNTLIFTCPWIADHVDIVWSSFKIVDSQSVCLVRV